jgi:hypothetical protein
MTNSQKSNSLQSYSLLVYRKAIHPDFFAIEGRQRLENGAVEAEAWICKGGHSIRYQCGESCVVEVIADQPQGLPERGLTTNIICAGEHDHEESVSETLQFMTRVQTETLAEHLYLGTYKEMLAHGRDNGSLTVMWNDPTTQKPNLSIVDLQRFRSEIHAQSWHLRSDCGLVLRTQSMFQLNESSPKPDARKVR